jgi:hypothetical protein
MRFSSHPLFESRADLFPGAITDGDGLGLAILDGDQRWKIGDPRVLSQPKIGARFIHRVHVFKNGFKLSFVKSRCNGNADQFVGLGDVAVFRVESLLHRFHHGNRLQRGQTKGGHHCPAGRFSIVDEIVTVKEFEVETQARRNLNLFPMSSRFAFGVVVHGLGVVGPDPAHDKTDRQRIGKLLNNMVDGGRESPAPSTHGIGEVKQMG